VLYFPDQNPVFSARLGRTFDGAPGWNSGQNPCQFSGRQALINPENFAIPANPRDAVPWMHQFLPTIGQIKAIPIS
jgi:hypothetical protein